MARRHKQHEAVDFPRLDPLKLSANHSMDL